MKEEEIKYLSHFYQVFFKCRIKHKSVPWDCTCYIFANYNDMQEYCKKNKIKFDKYNYRDYFLLNENNVGCLIGQRFNKVILVSSNVEKLVDKICNEAVNEGYDIIYTKEGLR